MSLSSTKIKKVVDNIGNKKYEDILRRLCRKYINENDKIELLYNTEMSMTL